MRRSCAALRVAAPHQRCCRQWHGVAWQPPWRTQATYACCDHCAQGRESSAARSTPRGAAALRPANSQQGCRNTTIRQSDPASTHAANHPFCLTPRRCRCGYQARVHRRQRPRYHHREDSTSATQPHHDESGDDLHSLPVAARTVPRHPGCPDC